MAVDRQVQKAGQPVDEPGKTISPAVDAIADLPYQELWKTGRPCGRAEAEKWPDWLSQAATNWLASSLFRAFLVAGAFKVMKATPAVISRSIISGFLGWVLVPLEGGGIGHLPIMPR
jgi:hypothetical protein